LVDMVLI